VKITLKNKVLALVYRNNLKNKGVFHRWGAVAIDFIGV